MKIILWKELVFGMILLLSVAQISNAEDLKSQSVSISTGSPNVKNTAMISTTSTNDLDLTRLIKFLKKLPLIGGIIRFDIDYGRRTFTFIDEFTNGALTRYLIGSLPCKIDLITGLTCRGAGKQGGFYGLLKALVYGVSDEILPLFLKQIIIALIKLIYSPLAKMIFVGASRKRR